MGNTSKLVLEVSIMQTTLRHWDYYNLTDTFTELYESSQKGEFFYKLYDLIVSRENILLAFRSIKANKGSNTPGTDNITIGKYKNLKQDEFIGLVRDKLTNYQPKKVKRVLIPKPNGDKRPLGIPSMFDRLIQQMFKQVLEPIAEAKFYKHSYGFRPARGASHAKARIDTLINIHGFSHSVDIDIKGFFDNVNHTLLNKQLWNMGIRDRKVLAIISKMLKSPIDKEGIPTKGTPQGGILSPLLSNIVLNDLDHWVAGQWEFFETNYKYGGRDKYKAMDKTKLKKGFIIRYADDFKILCKDAKTAWKWYHAVRKYLKDRLKLDISPEKSQVVNLRKRHTEFLGFKIKAVRKGKRFFAKSNIRDKKIKEIKEKAKRLVKRIQNEKSSRGAVLFNTFVLGEHNYFKYATHAYKDFNRISFDLSRTMHNRLKNVAKYGYPDYQSITFNKYFGHIRRKTYSIGGINMFPLAGIRHQNNMNFSQDVTPFTDKGRTRLYTKLDSEVEVQCQRLMTSRLDGRSLEYMDNRISRYSMKKGKCEITKQFLDASEVHCHHYKPISLGGDDSFKNLRNLHYDVHRLVHATNSETIKSYLSRLNLNYDEITTVNRYRKACNLELIN